MAMSPRGPFGTAARAGLFTVAAMLRLALLAAPLLLLRAALAPRERRLSDLTDRELADVGLAPADVERLCGRLRSRPGAPSLDPRAER